MRSANWKRFLRAYRPHRGRVAVALVLSILQGFSLFPLPILIRAAIDTALPEGDFQLLVLIGLGMVGLAAASAGLSIAGRRIDLALTIKVATDLRAQLYRRLFEMPRSSLDATSVSELHDTLVHDTQRAVLMNTAVLSRLVPDMVVAIGVTVVLFILNWQLAIVMLLFGPMLVGSSRLVLRRQRPAVQDFHKHFRSFSSDTMLAIASQDLIRLTGAEQQEIAKADVRLDELRRSHTLSSYLMAIHSATQQAVIAAAGAVLLVVGGWIVIETSMTIGDLIGFYAAFALLRGPLGSFAQTYGATVEGQQALERIYEFLDDDRQRPYQGGQPIDFQGTLSLEHATFGYDESKPIVRDISVQVQPGSVTALLGPNGSGKSTVVNLLLGFYRPQSGTARADGIPYDDVDLHQLRSRLGVVQQEPKLLPDTVRNNITYGRDVTDEQLERALRTAGADLVVNKLPRGLDTVVGEHGKLLSGGQRQRIAIARALIDEPRVLVLDEPTNHLDERAIAALLEQIREISSGIGVLIISHQRQVQEYADHVVDLGFGDDEVEAAPDDHTPVDHAVPHAAETAEPAATVPAPPEPPWESDEQAHEPV